MEENVESLANLEENLNYYGKSIKTLPLVMQYNKRDLPDVTPVAEMEQILNPDKYPYFESVAATGEGVLQTLTKITKMVLKHIEMGTSGKAQQRKLDPAPERIPVEQTAHQNISPAIQPGAAEKSEPLLQQRTLPGQPEMDMTGSPDFTGGRIQIVGTENAKIISVNAISIPLHLKIEGDSRTFTMDLAVKIDRIVPEG